MGITTKYFSNTSNFERIAEALRTANRLPDKIDESILQHFGYTNPADALILRFFKDLNFLDEEDAPTPLLEKFRDPEQSKQAISTGILHAYADLFDENPTIHLQPEESMTQLFESKMGEEKSNIIIGYMVKTFKVLIDYAGAENISEAIELKQTQAIAEEAQSATDELIAIAHGAVHNGNGTAVLAPEQSTKISEGINGELSSQDEEHPSDDAHFIDRAHIKKAMLLYKLNRLEEALPALDLVYERFGRSQEAYLFEQASDALIKKMNVAEKLHRNDELLPIYSEVINRLKDSKEPSFVQSTDHAYIQSADMMLAAHLQAEALEVFEEAISRMKGTERNPEFLAKAMFTKANLLEELGSDEEALAAVEEFLEMFG